LGNSLTIVDAISDGLTGTKGADTECPTCFAGLAGDAYDAGLAGAIEGHFG